MGKDSFERKNDMLFFSGFDKELLSCFTTNHQAKV